MPKPTDYNAVGISRQQRQMRRDRECDCFSKNLWWSSRRVRSRNAAGL